VAKHSKATWAFVICWCLAALASLVSMALIGTLMVLGIMWLWRQL